MAAATILLIGVTRAKDDALNTLEKHYHVVVARSGRQALDWTQRQQPDAIVLDAVSMNTVGDRISRSLKVAMPDVPIVHIHPGPRDKAESAADVVLLHPVSVRRLKNSVGRLLHVDEEEVICCGPFRMNLPRRILLAHGKETQLTPKAAALIEVFMRNPGETLDRKTLMAKVWETDYLGDTRTLDVHIRWLRKVMENGGKRPRYLQTVRGVGYRLDVPDGNGS